MRGRTRLLAGLVFCTIVVAAILWWYAHRRPTGASATERATATSPGASSTSGQNPDSCKMCMDACTNNRENCRTYACQQVGGTPQGSQKCDNIPSADARMRYNALITACFDAARACEGNCRKSGNCK
jgi:hypothetical protein